MKPLLFIKFICLLMLVLVAACGNPNLDEEDANNTNTGTTSDTENSTSLASTTSGYSIRLSLVKALDSQATTTISNSNPGKLIAIVTDQEGQPLKNVVISFSTDFAVFSPASATALTDDNGQANILLLPGELAGAGTVTAAFTYQEEEITTNLNFTVASSTATISNQLSVKLTDENSNETTSIRADSPGTLTATLTDENGNGVSGVVVQVQGTLATFRPENGIVITDQNGIARVQLLATETTGADTLSLTATTTEEILSSLIVFQVNPPALQFGNGNATVFNSEEVLITNSTLAASSTTGVTVDILDANGDPFTLPIDVNFTSNCVAAGTSAIDAKVSTINGRAIATYESKGCQGEDIITATATYSGTIFTASGTVTVSSEPAGFIEFVSASPEEIAISGTGGAGLSETSLVTFRVRSKLGTPLANQLVDFSLNTEVGGISVTPASKTTNSAGDVTTTVQSGSIGSTVRVTAGVNGTNISAQSDQLTVSTGVPDQDSISLSVDSHNPEAFSYDDATVEVTAKLADRFNNPVPDGTAVYFTTEGGSIEPSCRTESGSCFVIWSSQDPRPIDHRATILAVAIGDESFFDEDGNGFYNDNDGEPFLDVNNGIYDEPFTDGNGNNIFDEPFVDSNTNNTYNFGESFVDYNRNGRYDGAGNNPAGETSFVDSNANGLYDGSGTVSTGDSFTDVTGNSLFNSPGFSDLPEAFLDSNENLVRDSGEFYLDFNNNGTYDLRDGQYNGTLCSHTSICSTNRSIHVRKSNIIVMSGSFAYIIVQDVATGDIYGSNNPSVSSNANLNIAGGGSANLRITVADHAGQVMPEGTTIGISTDVGELIGELDRTIGSTRRTGGHTLSIIASDDDAATTDSGLITIIITSPRQHITTLNINLGV